MRLTQKVLAAALVAPLALAHDPQLVMTNPPISPESTSESHRLLQNLVITVPLSTDKLAEIKTHFKHVHVYPDGQKVPKEVAREVEVWYSNPYGVPDYIGVDDVPELKLVQLTSAGANLALKGPVLGDKEAQKRIAISSASGIHVLSIPQWILSQTISLYQHIYLQTFNLRTSKTYTRDVPQLPFPFSMSGKTLYGKTAGLLGYGHIARETARLLKAFNVKVIAANSNGEKRDDEGYIIPGTGDSDGSIPSAYYSTNDPQSFETFLNHTDILIASLPSTPQTHYLLDRKTFSHLKEGAVFINVGRGDLVKSEELLAALDAGSLTGAALDVTDPEPLPDNHPLFTHPLITFTPHTSSNVEGYFDVGADLLVENVKRIRQGGKVINKVDPEKGY
ncbi:hypothetical protein IAR50_000880 [Cryptococcus sp. DSM 104548]